MPSDWCKTKRDLDDFISFVVLYGPNEFPPWRNLTMDVALEEISRGIESCSAELGSEEVVAKARALVADATVAYRAGNVVAGAHLLQDLAALL